MKDQLIQYPDVCEDLLSKTQIYDAFAVKNYDSDTCSTSSWTTMELAWRLRKSSCGLSGFRMEGFDLHNAPDPTEPDSLKKKIFTKGVWFGPSSLAGLCNQAWAKTHRDGNLSAILAAADGTSTQRGRKRRVMWRRSASRIPDSTWKNKIKILEEEEVDQVCPFSDFTWKSTWSVDPLP